MADTDVIVIGAGLAGLAAAWFLRAAGCSVRVVERRSGVALETSYANGGMVTPSMADPWNAPGVQWRLLRWLGRADAPMLLRPSALPQYVGWGTAFLKHSLPRRHRAATAANFALAAYSAKQIKALRQALALEYEAGTLGTMKVFRDARAFDLYQAHAEHLRELGLSFAVLDAAGAARLEPCLAERADRLRGALHFPDDETGDAHRFCHALQERLVARGVPFSFDTPVAGIRVEGGRVTGIATPAGPLPAAAVVVSAGPWSPGLLAPLGVEVSVQPVKGYSLSVPLSDPSAMPRLAIVDDALHASATPLGATLRLAGTAEFSGFDPALRPDRLQNLWNFVAELSPRLLAAADRGQARPWCGFRPMAADGRPYIGATAVPGLFVNCGHGHLGWTQSAGSGALLAQLMTQSEPAIDPAPYAVDPGTRAHARAPESAK